MICIHVTPENSTLKYAAAVVDNNMFTLYTNKGVLTFVICFKYTHYHKIQIRLAVEVVFTRMSKIINSIYQYSTIRSIIL